jgi:carbamoyltransferase
MTHPAPTVQPADVPALRDALAAFQRGAPEVFEQLFSDGRTVAAPATVRGTLAPLRAAGLLVARGLRRRLAATVRLYDVEGRVHATDRPDRRALDQVFPLMLEQAFVLARMEAAPGGTVLEPCVGSGVLALAAAARGAQVVGTDINPRALAFALFNARLAGLEGSVALRQGSLLAPLRSGERFAQVVVNPPFEPAPSGVAIPLHSSAGTDGLSVLRELLPALPAHVSPGGRVAIVTWVLGRDEPWAGLGPLLRDAFPAARRTIQVLADDPLAGYATRFAPGPGTTAWRRDLADRGLERIRLVYVAVDTAGPAGEAVIEDDAALAAARRTDARWHA